MSILYRPEITDKRIAEINSIIAANPDYTRSQISIAICKLWDWRSPDGKWKDISSRDMLRALDKAGKIVLPPAKFVTRKAGQRGKVKHLEHNTTEVESSLSELRPISLEIVDGVRALEEFKSYIDQFHYLGFDRTVGENMKYIVRGHSGVPLACMLFGSAAWSCGDRDRFIGWDKTQRSRNLQMLTNQTRFLVFPWIRIQNLASHALSLVSKRISQDWERKYGHSLAALETFVEVGRFHGTVYKSSNWIRVGRTLGRGRDGGHHYAILPEKDVYLLPLCTHWRDVLLAEPVPYKEAVKEVGHELEICELTYTQITLEDFFTEIQTETDNY
jgi:hypothetical protein